MLVTNHSRKTKKEKKHSIIPPGILSSLHEANKNGYREKMFTTPLERTVLHTQIKKSCEKSPSSQLFAFMGPIRLGQDVVQKTKSAEL